MTKPNAGGVVFLIVHLVLIAGALNYDKTLWPRLLDYLAGAVDSFLRR